MKRILTIVLSLLTVLVCFSGCSKEATSSVTTSEMMEKYQESPELAEVWLYDNKTTDGDLDITTIQATLMKYNLLSEQRDQDHLMFDIKMFDKHDMDYDQYKQKLQAALMTGNGPDLVLSHDPDLFADIGKLAEAGALKSFNDIIATWDGRAYYTQVIESVRSSDGNVYILPISYDPDVIVTTNELLEQYRLTEKDFDYLEEAIQSLISIGEQLTDQPDVIAEWTTFASTRWLPSIYSKETRKTNLMSESVQGIFADWKKVQNLRLPHYPVKGTTGMTRIAEGKQVVSITPLSETSVYLWDKDYNERERFVYLPMRDVDGDMTGTIGYYALLPKLGEHEESIAAYLDMLLFSKEIISMGAKYENWLTKDRMDLNTIRISSVEVLSEVPMRLNVCNQVEKDIIWKISDMIVNPKETVSPSDWEELERSINIYLSE